jgi:hypothetical protein
MHRKQKSREWEPIDSPLGNPESYGLKQPDGSVYLGVDDGLLVQIAPAIAADPHPRA